MDEDDILADLRIAWGSAYYDLQDELADASFIAAGVGVAEAQAKHPYTDRTGNLTGTATPADTIDQGERGALMAWPMPYGTYVDEGTTRSKAYPFTPVAADAAETSLQGLTEVAAERFARRLSSE